MVISFILRYTLFAVLVVFSTLSYSQGLSDIISEETTVVENSVDVLLIDNSKTKAGRDFYEKVYRNWQIALSDTTEIKLSTYLNKVGGDLIVVIDEFPGMGSSSIISISVDELVIWNQNLQPKADLVEFLAENAILYVIDYVMNYAEYMEQLKSEDLNGEF